MASNQITPGSENQDNSHAQKRAPVVIEATAPVKIADLVPRNNNSSFVGKIVELEVITKGVNKNDQPRKFFKGVVGDETGLIRFDLAEKDGVQFAVGNIVQFEKAMNKVSNQGHHYVDVKRYGTYSVLPTHSDITVNSSVNKSEAVIPRLPEGEVPRHHKPRHNNNHGNRENNNNSNNNSAPRQKTSGQNSSKGTVNHNNNRNNNGNGRQQQNRPTNQRHQNQQQQQNNYNNRPQVALPPKPINISQLQPGTIGQVVIGQIIELNVYNKTIGEHEQTFFKGRIADETGSINFDFKMRGSRSINNNDVIQFMNIINKVNDNGYHYLTIGKQGYYNVVSNINVNKSEEANKSAIEYVLSKPQ